MTVIWSWQAVSDLAEIRERLKQMSPQASSNFVARIRDVVDDAESFPRLGRPGRRRGERELPVGRTPWILVYRVAPAGVEILHVWDGRRDLPKR